MRVFQDGAVRTFAAVSTVTSEPGGGYSERGLLGVAVSVEIDRQDAANGGPLSFKVNGQEIKVNMPAGVLQIQTQPF